MVVVCCTAPRGPDADRILPYNTNRHSEVGELNAMANGNAAVLPANPVFADVNSAIVEGRAME